MKKNFSIGMHKEWKVDDSPLTVTDLAINQLVLETLGKHFPTHSVISEEGSIELTKSEYAWVCDPVDGTIPFSHGSPTFAFSLALTHHGKSILGVVYDPILDRLLVAELGKGTTLNGKRVTVSKLKNFKNAFVDLESPTGLCQLKEVLVKETFASTIYSAVYAGLLVACGELVGEVYEFDKPWDAAALKIIIEEAGGRVTDINGKEQRYDRTINGFIASNKVLHTKLVRLVKKYRRPSK